MTDKYFIVRNQDYARALLWITGQTFMKFDDKWIEGGKIYSFVNTPEIQLASKSLLQLQKEIRSKQ